MTLINVAARLSLIPLIIALLFKAMNWPGAGINLILASLGLLIFHSLKFIKTKNKQHSDYILFGLVFLFGTGSLFQIFSGILIPSFGFICLLGLLVYLIVKFQIEKALYKQHIVATLFFWPSIFLVIFGCLFKLMHWPGASIMLILGCMIGMIWVVASLLNFKLNHKATNEIDEIGKL